MRFIALAATLAALTFVPGARAQDYQTILDIPAGQTLVNLSATERVEVEQDLLVATLQYESQDKDPRALQDRINEIMKKAVAAAKTYPDVKVSTQQYYVYQNEQYDNEGRPTVKNWRGQQGLQLESKQADALLKLTGELQAMGLVMSNLNYTLSQDLLEKTQESLLEAALKKLQSKAIRAAAALGKTKADLLEVNVDMGGGHYPQPMPMMAREASMGMAKMDAPVADPGESDITLTVSARAMLK